MNNDQTLEELEKLWDFFSGLRYLCKLFRNILTEVRLTDFLTLRLENGQVNIYVAGEYFNQCKSLLLDVPITEKETKPIDSIDEAEEMYSRGLESNKNLYRLTPKEEFWGHCSNLQVWVENDYDTRLLHRNLAFPLLRKLASVGDKKAQTRFKEEILERSRIALEKGADSILLFFLEEEYYNPFFEDPKEREFIQDIISYIFNKIKDERSSRAKYIKSWIAENPNTPLSILKELSKNNDFYVRVRVEYNPILQWFENPKLEKDELVYPKINKRLEINGRRVY